MKAKALYYRLLVLAGILGIVALSAWDYYQIRGTALRQNERWVNSVSSTVDSQRQSLTRWLERFPVKTSTFRDIANSRSDVAALYLVDLKSREAPNWTRGGLQKAFEPIDPRLGVLQLQAIQTQKTLPGPVIFAKEVPYFTVARPVSKSRALIAFIDASDLWNFLKEEAKVWHMRVSVYDYERHRLLSISPPILKGSTLEDALQQARTKKAASPVNLSGKQALSWLVTTHFDPKNDWIFIVTQPSAWAYAPILLFLASLAGILLLSRIPFRAASAARRAEVSVQIASYASKVDGYIRGRDGMLPDPPSTLKELGTIAASTRWLMPQWKKAEAFPRELALERKLLSLLVESLPEGILFFNAQGGLQLSNELGRVFLGLEQEGREPRMVNGIQVPRGFLEPYLEPVFTNGQPNLGKEVEVAWADGKHLYRLWVERVEAETGTTGGFIIVVRDITFRKQWEYVQEQVLSGITHDLRGPLSAVLGYMDLMKRQLGDTASPKIAEYLKLARESGVRLSQMVSDILDVVRFEQGKIDITVEAIPVVEMFQRLKNTFEVIAEQKKVQLTMGIIGNADLRATGDRKLLERVLDNLVGNAIKFTPAEGNITVTAKTERDRVIFDVVDTGRGIPREAQSRIFDKFQQVRPGDRSTGYGLGLAVSKFIIEAHQGEIRVESEVGMGSRFSFWVPIRHVDHERDGLVSMDPNQIMKPPRG